MKVFRVVLIIFVIFLAVLFIGSWIFLSTLDVNRYIPQVADAVTKATGRQLKVGHAGLALSFNKGVVLELKDVSLSDDPKFANKPFLTVGQVLLALDVRAAVLERSIIVSEVSIVSPEVTIIRTRDGAINAATIGVPASVSAEPAAARPSGTAAQAALPALLVKKLEVRGATVHYIDRLFEPAIALDVNKITLDIKGLSLTDPFDVLLSAALFSADPNINITGRAGIDMLKLAVRFDGMKVVLTVDKILPAELNNALPMIKPLGFKEAKGVINVEVKSAIISAKGLEGLDAEASAQIKDAVLEGINLLAAGLNSIPLPGLTDTVASYLPPETQDDMRKGVTAIDQLEVLADVNQDVMTIKKGEVSTRDLSASATGAVRMAGTLDMSAKLFIAPKLSDLLIKKVSDLGGLKKDDGRICIPFSVSGPMIKPQVQADTDYLTKNLLIGRGTQELQKVLGDPAVGKAVGDLLNSIFKSK